MTEQEWLTSNNPARMLKCYSEQCMLNARDVSHRKLRLFVCACARQVWDKLTDDAPCPDCKWPGATIREGFDAVQAVINWGKVKKACRSCLGTGRINRSRRAVEVAERYADGLTTQEEFEAAMVLPQTPVKASLRDTCYILRTPTNIDGYGPIGLNIPPAIQAALFRCIVGNPFRPVTLPRPLLRQGRFRWAPEVSSTASTSEPDVYGLCPWLTANDGAVVKLARSIYEHQTWDELPILADALIEAGCVDETCPECRGRGRIWVDQPRVVPHWNGCHDCQCTGTIPHPLVAHLRGPGPHARGCHAVDVCLGRS